jgi:hypothetical protein
MQIWDKCKPEVFSPAVFFLCSHALQGKNAQQKEHEAK